ncbi:ATP-binding cassette domain-containing protein [Aeromonas hydrophila]|uniref:ATP-binding cassette domain-containing protein n=1 Tax=Aeromonas hydrophila TaxID=644 RepID=UPI00049321E8|nr:ATP-binding cassette domain-containing protein [Aeromonas hydrophila]MBM0512215.1 ATP-binding cassette domain-containing protein [Aeromonas hydrophila]MBW3772251.1 ATP-binding cassette domain-containing protein [Aeromonas hydrophila]MCP3288163.1 ATP-binding cassette domain-containing protein [Aeromonas hydrophila]HAT1543407.1 ATP-binding cassette domain-containing protein [Aeromonas hydrophila]HAT1557450.1 ATP-binding cassette domain-containing protein [Aeromonas hydrophila]
MLNTTPLRLYLDENLLLSLPALQVAPGEVLTLMGPSGCGKSSLLAALAGVLPASGPIRLEGDVTLGERQLTRLPPQVRRIGMLFQDDLLFDHLTVAENLMFGMPATIKGKSARREKAVATLAQVALADQADKLPGTLSGGQKARVSLLRALLAEPEALLLDEPFSRLDKPLRAAFRELVFAQIKALAIPAILVTHDADDAPGTILQLTASRF